MLVGAYAAAATGAIACDVPRLAGAILDLDGVTGLELPYTGTDSPNQWLAHRFAGAHALTLIPALFARLLADTAVGLASRSASGRAEAIALVDGARRAVHELGTITVVHLQSSGRPASSAAFADSIADLQALDWGDARLVVEHCDASVPGQDAQKGFLTLSDEIAALSPGIDVAINWGRSAIETRSENGPLDHIREARTAGRLAGVMFSGAGASASPFGAAWADVHLPPTALEPTSLMTAESIAACVEAAGPDAYLGVKVAAPPHADDAVRLSTVARTVGMVRQVAP
ncbi:MAG: DUF4862 family protein [Rhodoglobus sp.]